MTASKILFLLGISFILGVFLSSVLQVSQTFVWVFLFVGILLIFIGLLSFLRPTLPAKRGEKQKSKERKLNFRFQIKPGMISIFGFCILVLCLGVLRNQISLYNIENNNLIKLNDNADELVFVGKIIAEPDNRNTIQKLKFKADNLDGIILITKNKYPEYKYLDRIKISGKLKIPQETEDFSYKNYLLKDGIYSVMDFPKIELLDSLQQASFTENIYKKVLFVKQKLNESIIQNYSPPHSFVMQGTILGSSASLTNELKNQLNTTGLRHIIAVSGTHIIILSSILLNLFLLLGFWRGQAFYGSVSLIWLYILITGLPASGIRAGIMATLFLFAQKIGRIAGGERIVVIACAIMLMINPLLLIYDIGFQLSFMAVLGLIYLDKFIKKFILQLLSKLIKNTDNLKLDKFSAMVSATLSAQIFTLPIMLYNFGNISIIAPVANILVLPIVEYLMIFGFLSAFLGMFSNILGFILSVPCYVLISYFLKVLEIFSGSWASKTIENIHWIWLIILYFIILLFTAWVKKKERENQFY